jgi:hypothetical protein
MGTTKIPIAQSYITNISIDSTIKEFNLYFIEMLLVLSIFIDVYFIFVNLLRKSAMVAPNGGGMARAALGIANLIRRYRPNRKFQSLMHALPADCVIPRVVVRFFLSFEFG